MLVHIKQGSALKGLAVEVVSVARSQGFMFCLTIAKPDKCRSIEWNRMNTIRKYSLDS